MEDLLLWRLLHAETPDPDRLASLLEELALRPPLTRVPYLGAAVPFARHPDPRLRAAALRALHDCGGFVAARAIVHALDDGEPTVRDAAADAVRALARSQPDRWAHLVFHPDVEVRRAALRSPLPAHTRELSLHLLADPALTAEAEPLLGQVPPAALTLLFHLAVDGRLDPARLRPALAQMAPAEVLAWSAGAPWRTVEEVDRLLAAHGAVLHGTDRLDAVFSAWVAPGDDAERRRFFQAWTEHLRSAADEVTRRVGAAIVVAARRSWTDEALGLLVNHVPEALGWTEIPRDARARSVDAIYREGPRRAVDEAVLDALLACDLARRPSGEPDLRFCGALICFMRTERFHWLAERLGLDAIADAFFREPERSAALLSVPDASKRGRHVVLTRLLAAAGRHAPFVRAIAMTIVPKPQLSLYAQGSPAARLALFEHLLSLEHHPALRFGPDRAKMIAEALAELGDVEHARSVLEAWMALSDPVASTLGVHTLRAVAGAMSNLMLARTLAGLSTPALRALLPIAETRGCLDYAQERALAELLADHPSPVVSAWAADHAAPPAAPPPRSAAPGVRAIGKKTAGRIWTSPTIDDVAQALHGQPFHGFVGVLAARPYPAAPSVAVAVALLGCHDPPHDVAKAFEQYVRHDDPAFWVDVDRDAVKAWEGRSDLPRIGDAWIWRFERHAMRAAEDMMASEGGLVDALLAADVLPSRILAQHLWAAAARATCIWSRREPARLRVLEGQIEPLLDLILDRLDTDVGLRAAQLLRGLHQARVTDGAIAARRDALIARLPDASDEVRRELSGIVEVRGLPAREEGARTGPPLVEPALLEAIRASTDPAWLASLCREHSEAVAHEAALRAIGLGDDGCGALAALLLEEPSARHVDALTASLPLWPDGDALDAVRRHLAAGNGTPRLRFAIAVGLLERGDEAARAVAVEALLAPWADRASPARSAVERVFEGAPDPLAIARRLAPSPHPHAYLIAVERLLADPHPNEGDRAAVRAFLDAGDERMERTRKQAARWLRRHGDAYGLPILISMGLAHASPSRTLFDRAPDALVAATVEGALATGVAAAEDRVLSWLDAAPRAEDGYARILADAADAATRSAAIQRLPRSPRRAPKLQALAETFAWGLERSRELCGRVLRPHLISGAGLGFTRLNESRIYVTPLPLLRGERHGRELVEGLILHEIGHHRHHRGDAEQRIWSEADRAGLGKLLNLVADEHLERNLRAFDPGYGDRLKRLAAYAFQHAEREVGVLSLLDALGGHAFDVLTKTRLGAGRRPHTVRVETGPVLGELEKSGSSFARFARALRMGLGDRHGDPKVEAALALFTKAFRRADMAELWRITKELHRIFGDEVVLTECFGGAESLEEDGEEGIADGEGTGDHEVQREVERILGAPDKSRRRDRRESKGRLQINVGADERFDEIHEVERVAPDPARHREVARGVSRHARRLRAFLERLGLALEPQRMRLRGRRLDTTRIRPLVTRGDPRVLLARELRRRTDLHLSLIVDCSGSMHGASMERAHAFGVLLTEAVRGLRGVDLRIFGFDDHTIFDAGDARRPAVTSLAPGGGNNDAAGLWHAAQVAMTSPRRARVLVMISDGLPTECSVTALRGLVRRLTKRHQLVCAQVAVRPLEEVCFPHYVEVNEDNLDRAVQRFGRIIGDLVGRTLTS